MYNESTFNTTTHEKTLETYIDRNQPEDICTYLNTKMTVNDITSLRFAFNNKTSNSSFITHNNTISSSSQACYNGHSIIVHNRIRMYSFKAFN